MRIAHLSSLRRWEHSPDPLRGAPDHHHGVRGLPWRRGHDLRGCENDHESAHDHGPDDHHLGHGAHSRGHGARSHGHDGRGRAHSDRRGEESNLHDDGEMGSGRGGEEYAHDDVHGQGQNQISMRPMGGYVPTI